MRKKQISEKNLAQKSKVRIKERYFTPPAGHACIGQKNELKSEYYGHALQTGGVLQDSQRKLET